MFISLLAATEPGVTVFGQQAAPWLTVLREGKPVGRLQAAGQPYKNKETDGPVFLIGMTKPDIRIDSQFVSGLAFIAWREAANVRVTVFALVPREGTPNVYQDSARSEDLRRKELLAFALPVGGKRVLKELDSRGIVGMSVAID
jgi:hypothetical protein